MKTLQERAKAVMPSIASKRYTDLGVVKGEGCYLYTDDGRKVLDFASGVAVTNLGHNHPAVVEAAKKQLEQLIHGGHLVVFYESYVALAEELSRQTGGDTMVYFSNSGAEVNDGAIKLAKYVSKKTGIIAFRNSFHGRTIYSAALTASNAKYRKYYDCVSGIYFAEYANCYRCPFGKKKGSCNMECLKQFDTIFHTVVDPDCVAAIIVEPVQGEGGYVVPPKEFLEGLRKICDEKGIYLIFDEVQSGFGRTGQLYAYQTFGIKPDIITSSKGIANGFPLAAIIAKKEIMSQWPHGAHSGTYGGNPVACAASLAVIKEMTEGGVLEHCRKMGAYFMDKLKALQAKHPALIGDVRGVGLMVAFELIDDKGEPNEALCSRVIAEALKKDLILLPCGTLHNVVRFMPPLIVTEKEIDTAIGIVDEALSKA
jgi:4-aminobutyrate aminotransferase